MPKRLLRILAVLLLVLLVIIGVALSLFRYASSMDPIEHLYADNCAVCHGEQLEGLAQGPPLVGNRLVRGESVSELIETIRAGAPARGMPAWGAVLSEDEIKSVALYVAERRSGRRFIDMRNDMPLVVPDGILETQTHALRLETVAADLAPLPFSIAPMPNGDILLTEKTGGLVLVHPDGTRTEVRDSPRGFENSFELVSLGVGLGWLLDVALHPDFAENGWIYVHFTERCEDCNPLGLTTSMNKLVRGRIRGGAWIDEETIWQADRDAYSVTPDLGAGGRLTFDPDGYVFMSIGMKGLSNYDGIQDLAMPYGKILRVHDDGRIPDDNPFVGTPGALPAIWSYGHRSPQGLEFDVQTGKLWETEMGPRGGDEVNLIQPGRNYGWPLYSLGQDYDGTPVEYGKNLGIEFDLADIEQPIADFTPAPAISSFVIYDGDAFSSWRRSFLVGSLKGNELYRVVIEGDRHVSTEVLVRDLGRIRDVEVEAGGAILLLLEHDSGGQIVRMRPADGETRLD